MNKKYFPFLALIAAVLLFIWVKQHQRGDSKAPQKNVRTVIEAETGGFNRGIARLVYSKHAQCRMNCRQIDSTEVKDILANGTLNESKIEDSDKGRSYPLEGFTKDKQHVRIVFAPHQDEIVVVTVIDLDKEWQCNCN